MSLQQSNYLPRYTYCHPISARNVHHKRFVSQQKIRNWKKSSKKYLNKFIYLKKPTSIVIYISSAFTFIHLNLIIFFFILYFQVRVVDDFKIKKKKINSECPLKLKKKATKNQLRSIACMAE